MKRTILLLLILLCCAPLASAEFMTNYSFGTSVSADSDQGAAYTAYKAVDSTLGTSWQSNSLSNAWWQGDFGTTRYIEGYNITATSGFQVYAPNTWDLQASNDLSTWYLLDQRSAQTGWGAGGPNRTYIIPMNKSDYRYYKFVISSTDYAAMGMLYLYNRGGSTASDTTPPDSISNLANTTTCENVTFTWANPSSPDYSHLYNLWDNIAQTNLTNSTTTKAFNPATVGTHTFSTKTVDLSYNMNSTWVNQTVSISACPTPTLTPTPTATATPCPASITSPGTIFDTNKTLAAIGEPIQFYDESVGGNVSDYNWTYGDGSYSAVRHSTHAYSSAGLFSVSLYRNLSEFNVTSNQTTTKANLITVYAVETAAAGLPYINNPSTDKKTDWLKLAWEWWWLPALILLMIWLFGGRR